MLQVRKTVTAVRQPTYPWHIHFLYKNTSILRDQIVIEVKAAMVTKGKQVREKASDSLPLKMYIPKNAQPVPETRAKRWMENGVPSRRNPRSTTSSIASSLASSPQLSPAPSPGTSPGPSMPNSPAVTPRTAHMERQESLSKLLLAENEELRNAINVIPMKKSALELARDEIEGTTNKMREEWAEVKSQMLIMKEDATRVTNMCKRWSVFGDKTMLKISLRRWARRAADLRKEREELQSEPVHHFVDIYASKRAGDHAARATVKSLGQQERKKFSDISNVLPSRKMAAISSTSTRTKQNSDEGDLHRARQHTVDSSGSLAMEFVVQELPHA